MRPLLVVALALAPLPALAQQPAPAAAGQPAAQSASSTCDVVIDTTGGRSRLIQAPGGNYDTYAGAGIWAHCRGQPTTMYSDSVAWYPERSLLYLVGNVRFRDSVTLLNADHVTYYLHQERLYAEGHVYTRNLRTHSDLRGNNLDYFRAAPPLRDTLELFAQQRPTIHFYASSQTAKSDTEPFVVVADRTHMKGSDEMWGGGHVTINRSDLAAQGDSAWLDLGHDAAALLGSPVVNGTGPDAYHLRGDLLTFGLTPQHEIRRVLSSGDAVANGPDWRLDADTLDLALDSGKVQRAQAWGRRRRPDAVSSTHTIVADSLDIHMPDQLVRLVWAWGTARMVTRDTTVHTVASDTTVHTAASDTTRRPLAGRPDTTVRAGSRRDSLLQARRLAASATRDSAARSVAAKDSAGRGGLGPDSAAHRVPARDSTARSALVGDDDWLTGDSLRADFAVQHDSASGKPRSELEHLTSFGSARALYHVENSDSGCAHGRRGLDYSRGRRIDIAMQHSKVRTVDVVGQSDGVYLEPDCPRADTTHAADTTRAAADTTGRPAVDTLRSAPASPRPAAPRPPAPPDTAAHPAPSPPAAVKPRP